MAISIPLIVAGISAAGTTYAGVAANQKSQDAKGVENNALATAAKAPANDASAASKAAGVARTRALASASASTGQASTILTGPLGDGVAPTQRKTLLGL